MNTYFTIGELAKLNHISKQTLIFYDKEGIFKPKIIDSTNGYRYYTSDQLEILDSILILKEIGLSLKDIKAFMEDRTSENTIILLKEQQEKIKNKIRHLRLIEKRLEHKVKTLEAFSTDEKNVVFLTSTKTEYLAIEKVEAPQSLIEVDIAMKNLLNRAEKYSYPHYYQIGAMIAAENLLNKSYINAQYAFIPLEANLVKGRIHKKPKGLYARLYHSGPYSSIGESYERLIEEIYRKGYEISGYSYEYCIFDSLTSKESEDYITEIQIAIKKP